MKGLKPGDIVVVYSLDGFPVTPPSMLLEIRKKTKKRWDGSFITLTSGKIEKWELNFWKVEKYENRPESQK